VTRSKIHTDVFLFPWYNSLLWARAKSLSSLHDHTQTHHTRYASSGRAVRRRDLYLTPHDTRKGQTSIPMAEFVPAIPASELPAQTHALDRAATEIFIRTPTNIRCHCEGFNFPGDLAPETLHPWPIVVITLTVLAMQYNRIKQLYSKNGKVLNTRSLHLQFCIRRQMLIYSIIANIISLQSRWHLSAAEIGGGVLKT